MATQQALLLEAERMRHASLLQGLRHTKRHHFLWQGKAQGHLGVVLGDAVGVHCTALCCNWMNGASDSGGGG